MCGRYTLFSYEEYQDLRRIIELAQQKAAGVPVKTGVVSPTDLAPVILGYGGKAIVHTAVWGFPGYGGKGVIINARAETAAEKPLFRQALLSSRCAVPATGFYEWNRVKEKYLFRLPQKEELYLAGLWQTFDGQRRYTILTTEPNESVRPVHSRMPVILPKAMVRTWLSDPDAARELLRSPQPELTKKQES